MKKVVINKCYGGFGLSRKAVKRLAELQGRACYFFSSGFQRLKDDEPAFVWHAFDIPNPQEEFGEAQTNWRKATDEELRRSNELYSKHSIDSRPTDRSDPLLVQVVEELGEEANGDFADLKIVEVPDDVEYDIEEYDGMEWVAERHRTWG